MKNTTPEKIVNDLMNGIISKKTAVEEINKLIREAKEAELIGTMGAEEYNYYKDLCQAIFQSCYKKSAKGNKIRRKCNSKEIKNIIQKAVNACGYKDFYSIPNTNDNQWKLRNAITGDGSLFQM